MSSSSELKTYDFDSIKRVIDKMGEMIKIDPDFDKSQFIKEHSKVENEDKTSGGTELAKAIIRVMNEVPYVQKQKVAGLNYSFAGEAALIESLHPAMVRNGLAIVPVGAEIIDRDLFTTKSGSVMRHVLGVFSYKLVHTSGEFVMLQTVGEANDTGDKAANKAMTAAYKYALRQAFNIETGDDPDRHSSQEQEAGNENPTPEYHLETDKVKELQEAISSTGTDLVKVLQHYKVKSIDRLTDGQYKHLLGVMLDKLKKMGG